MSTCVAAAACCSRLAMRRTRGPSREKETRGLGGGLGGGEGSVGRTVVGSCTASARFLTSGFLASGSAAGGDSRSDGRRRPGSGREADLRDAARRSHTRRLLFIPLFIECDPLCQPVIPRLTFTI